MISVFFWIISIGTFFIAIGEIYFFLFLINITYFDIEEDDNAGYSSKTN
jgi:hypothetical protein